MRIALFSDVHANLPALEAVLQDIESRRPDMLFCLGDLVGYAPWPNEVVDAVRRRGIPTIAGNYDEGVGLNSDDCGCAYQSDDDERRGAESIAFTNAVMDDDLRIYLRELPRHFRLDFKAPRAKHTPPLRILMVHGSPRRINEYLFEDRPDRSFIRMMESADADVMLFGHTHKPYHKRLSYNAEGIQRTRHAVNIGSVGKPKDGDARACFTMLDIHPDAWPGGGSVDVEFVRVEYDVERAAQAIEESPLPNEFAERLRSGT